MIHRRKKRPRNNTGAALTARIRATYGETLGLTENELRRVGGAYHEQLELQLDGR